jgi:hypothetical protein
MDFNGCIVATANSDDFSMKRWIEVSAEHPHLAKPELRQGTNPFSKEPMTIHPKPGYANVVVDGRVVGTMNWRKGAIQVSGDAEAVGTVAREVATALGGRYEPDDAVERHGQPPAADAASHPVTAGGGTRAARERRILNEYRVQLERVPRSEPATLLESSSQLGLRTKLGGVADWIQGDRTPKCKKCGEPMPFVAQIDSIEHQSANNPVMKKPPEQIDFMFADVGMIYVFFCFDCLEPQSLLQFY